MDIEVIRDFTDKLQGKIGKGDIVATYSETSPIDFDMDRLKSIEDINRFAVGLRLFRNGRVGNSYVNSLDDMEVLIKNAEASSVLGDIIDIDLPAMGNPPALKLYDSKVPAYPREDGVKLGEEMVSTLKSIDRNSKASVSISNSRSVSILCNTSGFSGFYEETRFGVSAGLLLVEDDGSLLHTGDGDSSYSMSVDIESIYRNIEWRYKNALKKVGVKTGYFPVIFAPEALDLILEPIEIAVNSTSLYRGISVLGDKIGCEIAGKNLTISDDPFYPDGSGSYPYDDEGIIPERMGIIENGIFKNFIYDLTNAKRLGKKSTGHARRGVSSLPSPGFSNLVISGGNAPLADMISSIDYGLIVYDFLGQGMSNVIAGDISVNIELGYLIENGAVKGRVKNGMLTGNVYDMMRNIKEIEDKQHKKGDLIAPHILFDKVSVAG